MYRTITMKQDFEIEMEEIASYLFGQINDYFVDYYNIDDPETTIADYNSVVADILKSAVKYLDD